MSEQNKSLAELVQELPPDVMVEVRDFIEFLLSKRQSASKYTLRQNWAGALREHKEQYTSLELQKQALTWRGD